MKLRVAAFFICSLVMMFGVAEANDSQAAREAAEAAGIDFGEPSGTISSSTEDPGLNWRELDDFLLIPESTNDRIMAFDATTGDLVNGDFIPSDETNLSTPIHAILGPGNDTILVSDQLEDVVQEYNLDGTYKGIFAPVGGADTSILDNIRGIALRDNGNLLVSVGGGTNADAIAEFDTAGNYLGNFVANAAGGLDSPFDVLLGTDALVGGITSDAIHRYDASTGDYIADLAAMDSFPEQLAFAGNGNILVANFSGGQAGVVELLPDGSLVDIYTPVSGVRGAYELPNGNILTTNGDGVHEIARDGTLVETKISGVSARFIEVISGAVPVELQSFSVE